MYCKKHISCLVFWIVVIAAGLPRPLSGQATPLPAQQPLVAVACRKSTNTSITSTFAPCSNRKRQAATLLQKWQPSLLPSNPWGWKELRSNKGRFLVLSRHLIPSEANIEFAQSFCLSKNGQLAYWDNQQQYAELAGLLTSLAKTSSDKWAAYIGLIQLPAEAGGSSWVWVHNNAAPAGTSFPWAASTAGNGPQPPGTKECTVAVASAAAPATATANMVNVFPCNYADSQGRKFLFNGWDPKLTVACRLKA